MLDNHCRTGVGQSHLKFMKGCKGGAGQGRYPLQNWGRPELHKIYEGLQRWDRPRGIPTEELESAKVTQNL